MVDDDPRHPHNALQFAQGLAIEHGFDRGIDDVEQAVEAARMVVRKGQVDGPDLGRAAGYGPR